MTASGSALPRGTTGRADLLRLLAVAPRDRVVLDTDASSWFGYERRPEPASQPTAFDIPAVAPVTPTKASSARLGPLQIPFLHAIVQRTARSSRAGETPSELPAEDLGPLTEQDVRAPKPVHLIGYEDLIPPARLMPALRRQLGHRRAGPLDLDRLILYLATQRLPRHLPRRRLQRWHPDLVVVLDFCSRLWPYREDMHRLAERLLRLVGRSGVSLRIMSCGPLGPWTDWLAHQDLRSALRPKPLPWKMPPTGTQILIVSDFGLLFGPDSATAQAWRQFIADLRRAQVCPLALAPLGPEQLDVSLRLPVLRWSPDARPLAVRARIKGKPKPDDLDDLLAMASAVRRVDPPLLRAMRQLVPKAPLNAGLEGALWCHDHVQALTTASVRPEAREQHLFRFAERLPALHAILDRLRVKHHAHLRAALNHEETLLWDGYADEDARCDAEVRSRVASAREFFGKLAKTVGEAGDAASTWQDVAEAMLHRADTAMRRRHGDVMHQLLAATLRARHDVAPSIPSWSDQARLAALFGGDNPAKCWLVQDTTSSSIVLQAEPPGPRQIAMGKPFALRGGARCQIEGKQEPRWLAQSDLALRIAQLSDPGGAHLETDEETLTIAPVRRPLGAFGWGCDRNGLFVRSAPLGPWQMSWGGPSLRAMPPPKGEQAAAPWALEAPPAPHPEAKRALRFGIEWRFGVYAELTITTKHGSATQQLRWIPPGRFLMGSPEAEMGRIDNEGPQHEVRISKGFWLFDTPCTQALWQAVMGENPSKFKSPDRPVERVSWDQVQSFLERINAFVPGLDLKLPTEAEWEYACRAGTETAIYTGDLDIFGECHGPALDPIAWYSGNSGVDFDLENGVNSSQWLDKQYPHTRAGTRAVGLKDPNAWGLYDMLGNVWEWCQDHWHETYDGAPTDGRAWIDEGADPGADRVLRGGSWFDYALGVRSACRGANGPDDRADITGFRCAERLPAWYELENSPSLPLT